MKLTKSLLGYLSLWAITISLAPSADAQAANERAGKVVRIKGEYARYSLGNNTWHKLNVGTTLAAGAIIQTGKDSVVEIVLTEPSAVSGRATTTKGDTLRLTADSILVINKLDAVKAGASQITETRFELRSGRIEGAARNVSAGSSFEVKLPNGVADVRGSLYAISADGVVVDKKLL